MENKFFITKKHITIISAAVLISLASVGIYLNQLNAPKVVEFDDARDTDEILALFKDDWYLLVQSQDFSPSYMLKTRSRSEDPRHKGNMLIKVLRTNDAFIGFTTYYKEYSNNWRLLFLAIKASERGKRYGEKLIDFAIKDMKKLGAKRVVLSTREENIGAQKLYKRVGFKEIDLSDGFYEFEIIP